MRVYLALGRTLLECTHTHKYTGVNRPVAENLYTVSYFFTRVLSFWKHRAHDRAWHPIIVLFMFVETINQQKYYSSRCLNSSSENKRRKQEREKEKAISISEVLFWPWFLGHSVFWEMMMAFGKCLFRWEIYFGSVVSRPSKGLTVPAVPACSPGAH